MLNTFSTRTRLTSFFATRGAGSGTEGGNCMSNVKQEWVVVWLTNNLFLRISACFICKILYIFYFVSLLLLHATLFSLKFRYSKLLMTS